MNGSGHMKQRAAIDVNDFYNLSYVILQETVWND